MPFFFYHIIASNEKGSAHSCYITYLGYELITGHLKKGPYWIPRDFLKVSYKSELKHVALSEA